MISEKHRTTDPTSTAVMEHRPRSNPSKVVRLDHHIFDGQWVAAFYKEYHFCTEMAHMCRCAVKL